MKFIEEVVVEEFLPTFRSMLARSLRERGLTQSEVADLLGISQSAVSKYVHGDVEENARLREDERVRDLVDRLAAGLVSGEMSQVQALAEAEVLVRRLERGDVLARLHEEQFPALATYEGEFAIHDTESRLRSAERILASVRRGLQALEQTGGFAALVPAVGSNLVEALPEGQDIDDVAAVPGRILDVKGRATVPADPEFGVSVFVASVLLAARAAGSEARAALNVRYEPDLVSKLTEQGYRAVEFDVEGEASRTGGRAADGGLEAAVADAFERTDGDIDVLYQTGGFGVEPIIYVLAPDAPTAVSIVRELL